MENASKALIIAGAVLISIVLISLGVILISKSGDVSGQADQAATTMNTQIQTGIDKINAVNVYGD